MGSISAQTKGILARLAETTGQPPIDEIFDILRQDGDVDHIVYHALNVRGLTVDKPYLRLTYPQAWIDRYFERDYFTIDPVVEEGMRASLPFNWLDLDWSSRRRRAFAEDARHHGISLCGYTVPIRGPDAQHAMFSVCCDTEPAQWLERTDEFGRELMLIAHYFHQAVIAAEGAQPSDPVTLSGREKAVLEWSAAGKTTVEIAAILEIAERTVRVYLDTSRHKLGATNRTHAVARAISLGLIQPPV